MKLSIILAVFTWVILGCEDDSTSNNNAITDIGVETDIQVLDNQTDRGAVNTFSDATSPNDAALTIEDEPNNIELIGNVSNDDVDIFRRARPGTCVGVDLVYPEDGTVFPLGFEGLEFQWLAQQTPVRLALSTDNQMLHVLTSEQSFVAEGPNWATLISSARGNRPITISLRTLNQDGTYCQTPPIQITISNTNLSGAVYYWSTTDSGIMRLPIGDESAELFLGSNPLADPPVNCPACHALSRDGNRMAFTNTSFPPFGYLAAIDTDSPETLLYRPNEDRNGNGMLDAGEDDNENASLDITKGYFPSFSPDNEHVVASTRGELVIINTGDGRKVETLPSLEEKVAAEPDWSWQGDRIVGILADAGLESIFGGELIPGVDIDLSAQGVSGGAIAIWSLENEMWGPPETLIPAAEGDQNLGRPAFDPTGTWVAFQSAGPDLNPNDDINENQSLYLSDSRIDTTIELRRANGAQLLGNNWPKWSPPTGGRYLWLAFSSLRAYGNVTGGGNPQIWITAIDTLAEPGTDPSAPAFWLPGQAPESGNHIPYWSAYEKL